MPQLRHYLLFHHAVSTDSCSLLSPDGSTYILQPPCGRLGKHNSWEFSHSYRLAALLCSVKSGLSLENPVQWICPVSLRSSHCNITRNSHELCACCSWRQYFYHVFSKHSFIRCVSFYSCIIIIYTCVHVSCNIFMRWFTFPWVGWYVEYFIEISFLRTSWLAVLVSQLNLYSCQLRNTHQ